MKPPAFQFYADDFVAGTVEMTTPEIGAYILLLCYQWSKGYVPDNDELIRRIARETQAFDLANVRSKFVSRRGKLFNLRLEAERDKQIEYREKQSKNGQKGGRPKNPSLSQALAKPKAKKSSPYPSPVLNTFSIKLSTPRITEMWGKWMEHRRTKPKPKDWNEMFNNQIEFLERYAEPVAFEILDASLRNGYQGLFPPKSSGGSNGHSSDFWQLTKELELVEKEIAGIKGRGSQTANGLIIEPRDKPAWDKLKIRRTELKTKLNLK